MKIALLKIPKRAAMQAAESREGGGGITVADSWLLVLTVLRGVYF